MKQRVTNQIRNWAAVLGAVVAAAVIVGPASDDLRAQNRRIDAEAKRASDAAAAFARIVSSAKRSIPEAVLEKAEGIAVFPQQPRITRRRGQGPNTLRTMRMLDVRGRGILSVRGEADRWSPPAFLELAGGTVSMDGDLVLVMMTRRGVEQVMRYRFEVDEAAVAPGPLAGDTQAQTEAQQRADIFAYSRSNDVLAGISLTGTTLQPDFHANQRFYGKRLTTPAAVAQTTAPDAVVAWRAALEKHTSR